MYEFTCPYCDKEIDDPDDCYDPEMTYEHECPHCLKNFVFTVDYIRTYSEKKADCLNGSEHKYSPTRTYPKKYTRMRCEYCDDTRPCTEDEMNQVMSDYKARTECT